MPKISALPVGSTLNATDQVAVNNGGTTRRFTIQQIATDHGMIAVANTTDLSNTAGTRARFVLVLNNGIFEYKTSGTPNGTTIFSALGGGVWEREMKHDDGSGGGGVSDGDKGDVVVSSSGTVWTVENASITLAKMANIATARFIGRTTAGTGAPEALTGTQATALLDAFTSGAKGLAPASGGGTTNFLRADGTWAAPPGGGGGGTVLSEMSVTGDGSTGTKLKLVNDNATPGNLKRYGTDAAGAKGWIAAGLMPDGINNGDGTYTPGVIFSNNAQKTGIMAATYPISTSAIGGHNGLEFIEGGLRCFSMYWDFGSDYATEKGQTSVLRSWASNRLSIESPVSIVHGSGNSRYEWEGTGGGGVLSFIGYDQGSSVGRSFLFGNDTGAGNSVVPVLFQPRENKNAFNIIDTSSAIKGAVTWDAKYGSGISAPTGNFHARKTTGTGGEVGTEILQDATQLTQQYIRHRYDNGTTINDIWYQMSDFNSGEVRDFVKAGGGYFRTFYANGAEALRLQNNGVFSVNRTADDSTGAKIQVGGSVSTDAADATRVAWKFGEAITGSSGITLNTTAYVKVNINGTLYNLALANLP